MSESHSIALTVAYDGAQFAGFARQPGLDTVQGRLETALGTLLRRDVETTGAGRTDSGVHALGQVVSFHPGVELGDEARLRRSLNALTGDGIVIKRVRKAHQGFSARFDAVEREYRYRIVAGRVPPLFLSHYAWHVPSELDVSAMQTCAALLVGEHDFRSFCVTESAVGQRTVRRVEAIDFAEEEHLGEECLTVRVVGNAFLHSMVRVIVGTLVEVGAGRRDCDWVGEVLAARSRDAAGQTAPARGLTFWRVRYPDGVWL
ncbi:MAG TPA: tRNA pseudouridine(38-40) synthase TruA [Coriobacteriia bacterium]|nr:tRNA pseudouridine(38-40) synthase TruA [Coriobacteriia bacterium]